MGRPRVRGHWAVADGEAVTIVTSSTTTPGTIGTLPPAGLLTSGLEAAGPAVPDDPQSLVLGEQGGPAVQADVAHRLDFCTL